jgi:hypothetical protein
VLVELDETRPTGIFEYAKLKLHVNGNMLELVIQDRSHPRPRSPGSLRDRSVRDPFSPQQDADFLRKAPDGVGKPICREPSNPLKYLPEGPRRD